MTNTILSIYHGMPRGRPQQEVDITDLLEVSGGIVTIRRAPVVMDGHLAIAGYDATKAKGITRIDDSLLPLPGSTGTVYLNSSNPNHGVIHSRLNHVAIQQGSRGFGVRNLGTNPTYTANGEKFTHIGTSNDSFAFYVGPQQGNGPLVGLSLRKE